MPAGHPFLPVPRVMDVELAEADIYALGGVAVEVLAVSVFPWKC